MKECDHEWEKFQNTRGTNPPVVTSTTFWCKKCKIEKPYKKSAHTLALERWADYVGEYR